jgi:hypothetical protein
MDAASVDCFFEHLWTRKAEESIAIDFIGPG